MTSLSRRTFLAAAAATGAAAALRPWHLLDAYAAVGPTPPFDHVVVLMMENRSFDHFLGWLPGSNGRQAGLQYTDTKGDVYPTYDLKDDFQGCGYADPDHSYSGFVKQFHTGRADGFLTTAAPGDTFPIGYYTESAIPVLGALAREYTTSDNYFAALSAETYPNRFYQHSATTDRAVNMPAKPIIASTLPTIWDRLAAAGLTGTYYSTDLPFTALWGPKYVPITRPAEEFFVDCAQGQLPNVAFIDPAFNGEGEGLSRDDHPHADIRSGEEFISQVYTAVRNSRLWDKTILVINYDEWGGFYDHVIPPRVVDSTPADAAAPQLDHSQLGFRVPCVVVSPFSQRGRIVQGGAPFEHTSVLRMIEWRWNLPALTARDANARNLADMLDFTQQRKDVPAIPSAPAARTAAYCNLGAVAASPPHRLTPGTPGSGPGGGGPDTGGSPGLTAGGGLPNSSSVTPGLVAAGAAAIATVAAASAARAARGTHNATAEGEPLP